MSADDATPEDFPVCPACHNRHTDAWEWDFGPGLEGEFKTECDACGTPILVTRQCAVTYTTKKLHS